jgi:U3 small nucleolar RNA-associated protein 20
LVLLNQLAESGYLSGGLTNVQGGRWRQSLLSALRDLLATFAAATDDALDRKVLVQVLHLITTVPGDASQLASHIGALVRRFGNFEAGDAQTAIAEWQVGGVWNDAHMLGSLLGCAESYLGNEQMESEIRTILVDDKGFTNIVRKWNWNAEVMGVLASVLTRSGLRVE